MSSSERGELAALVDLLLNQTHLTPTDIERNGGPPRTTLYLIRRGVTHRPEPETLRRLARALATHPWSGEVDMNAMSRYRRELFAAAHYDEPPAGEPSELLETALLLVTGDSTVAKVWAAFITDHRELGLETLLRRMRQFAGDEAGERSRQ